jgi:hypothetical protein
MRRVCNGLAQKPVGNERELGAWALVALASLLVRESNVIVFAEHDPPGHTGVAERG